MTEQEAHKVNELFKQIDEINTKYVDALETIRVLNEKIIGYADALVEASGCCDEKNRK